MLMTLLYILFIICAGGAIAFLVNRAPFIEEPMKSIAVWVIMVAVVIFVILVVAGMVPGSGVGRLG